MASFLGGLLATKDQPSLVTSGLQIVELLLTKLPDTYHVVFRREGVLHEVQRLAAADLVSPPKEKERGKKGSKSTETPATPVVAEPDTETGETLGTRADAVLAAAGGGQASNLTRALRHAESIGMDEGLLQLLGHPGGIPTPIVSTGQQPEAAMKDALTMRARYVRDKVFSGDSARAKKATAELDTTKALAGRLDKAKTAKTATSVLKEIAALFLREDSPISSFEMLESGLVDGLLRFTAHSFDNDRTSCNALSVKGWILMMHSDHLSSSTTLLQGFRRCTRRLDHHASQQSRQAIARIALSP